MKRLRFVDLAVHERAVFKLVCARFGFAPMHFHLALFAAQGADSNKRLLTVWRGSWTRSYQLDNGRFWIQDFESDLTRNFFK